MLRTAVHRPFASLSNRASKVKSIKWSRLRSSISKRPNLFSPPVLSLRVMKPPYQPQQKAGSLKIIQQIYPKTSRTKEHRRQWADTML